MSSNGFHRTSTPVITGGCIGLRVHGTCQRHLYDLTASTSKASAR